MTKLLLLRPHTARILLYLDRIREVALAQRLNDVRLSC
jgi:hypothetical protein